MEDNFIPSQNFRLDFILFNKIVNLITQNTKKIKFPKSF